MQKQRPERMKHIPQPGRKAFRPFSPSRNMVPVAEFENQNDKHQQSHDKMAAVKLGDAGKHKRNHRHSPVRVVEFGREQEARQNKKQPSSKSRDSHHRHEGRPICHVTQSGRRRQVQQDDVQRGQQPQAIYRRKINFLFHSGKCRKEGFNITVKIVKKNNGTLPFASIGELPRCCFKKSRLNFEQYVYAAETLFFSRVFISKKQFLLRRKGFRVESIKRRLRYQLYPQFYTPGSNSLIMNYKKGRQLPTPSGSRFLNNPAILDVKRGEPR